MDDAALRQSEASASPSPTDAVDRLAALLVARQHCDARTIERGRRVAEENGQRLDAVLIQLGLVSERGLAEAYASLLDIPLVLPANYPDEPILPERLAAKFLRTVRAIPLDLRDDALVIAAADPLDPFTPAVCAAATGRRVILQVAVPIELEAALTRLYPNGPADDALIDEGNEPLEEDSERLKDLDS